MRATRLDIVRRLSIPAFAALAFAATVPSADAAIVVPTTPTYTQGEIESSATSAPNDLASFATAVSAAHGNNTGAVANFEGTTGSDTVFTATYGISNAKTLTFTGSEALNIQTLSSANTTSGTRGLLAPFVNDTVSDAASITFAITGGDPGEFVTRVGITLLSRDGTTGDYTIAATLNTGGPLSATTTLSNSNGGDDTFFGFTAPAGTYITGMTFTPLGAASSDFRMAFDDLGFITSIVPEPATTSLLMLAAPLLLARRRSVK